MCVTSDQRLYLDPLVAADKKFKLSAGGVPDGRIQAEVLAAPPLQRHARLRIGQHQVTAWDRTEHLRVSTLSIIWHIIWTLHSVGTPQRVGIMPSGLCTLSEPSQLLRRV
jgi:hypothetical protein